MTREEFNRAFTEAVSMEFADVSCEDEIDFTFSEEFLRKMNNLIAWQQGGTWRLLHRKRKHVAMIAIIALGAMVTACGVVEIVKYMHHDLYLDMKQEFLESGGTLDENAEFHKLTYVPEGFALSGVSTSEGTKTIEYQNKSHDRITFMQDKTGEAYSILSVESVKIETLTINGNKVIIFENYRLVGAMWIEDGIYMEILYFDGSEMEELKKMVEGVK